MVDHEDGYSPGDEKSSGRDNRSCREPANTADTVPAGASVAQTSAETDGKSGNDDRAAGARDSKCVGRGFDQTHDESAGDEATDKTGTPLPVVTNRPQDPRDDTADSRNFAVKPKHRGSRQANQNSTGQRSNRSEIVHRGFSAPSETRWTISRPLSAVARVA